MFNVSAVLFLIANVSMPCTLQILWANARLTTYFRRLSLATWASNHSWQLRLYSLIVPMDVKPTSQLVEKNYGYNVTIPYTSIKKKLVSLYKHVTLHLQLFVHCKLFASDLISHRLSISAVSGRPTPEVMFPFDSLKPELLKVFVDHRPLKKLFVVFILLTIPMRDPELWTVWTC